MVYFVQCISCIKNKTGFVIRIAVLPVLFLLFTFPSSAQKPEFCKAPSSELNYQIARWQGFKKAAFSISFDDNYRFQVIYANPLVNLHHYKATYFIVTNRVGKGWAPGWDTLTMLASQGHEIGSHSKNHADFNFLSQFPQYADSMKHEFRDSRDTINARIPSQKCVTFAWPGGAVNDSAISVSRNYYMACRGSSNFWEDSVPYNYYNLYSHHIYHDTPLTEVNTFIDSIIYKKGWLVERWHGFRVGNDTNGYEPVPIEEFRDHLDYVAQNEDNLWITTLDSVVKYIRERQASTLSLIDSSGNCLQFSLITYLPDTSYHYHIPLSLKVRMFGDMKKVVLITQNNQPIPFSISYENGAYYLYFDAIPNEGFIVMHMIYVGTDDLIALNEGAGNYPNPFTSFTNILFEIPEAENIDIQVFDKVGRVVRNYSRHYPSGRNSIEFDGSGLPPGIYTCIIRTRERKMDVRMVLTH